MQDQSHIVKLINLGVKTGFGGRATVNSGKAKPVYFASLKPVQEDGTTENSSLCAKDGKMKVNH